MEVASLVAETLLASAKGSEILTGLGSDVGTKLEGNTADIFSANCHVKLRCVGCVREGRKMCVLRCTM